MDPTFSRKVHNYYLEKQGRKVQVAHDLSLMAAPLIKTFPELATLIAALKVFKALQDADGSQQSA